MTAIGEQLRKVREQKNLSLDQVADDTNIAKRYLVALEEENFQALPAEPYAIGFIRTYADYLGLKGEELVNAYKGMRIQEQPIPVDQLIPKAGPGLPAWAIALIAVASIALVAGGALLAFGRASGENAEDDTRKPVDYVFQGASFERRVYPGDAIVVPFGGQNVRLEISSIDDFVNIGTPAGTIRFMMAEESTIDLDRNNRPELRVYVSDYQKNKPEKGALVRLDLASGLVPATSGGTIEPALEVPETESAKSVAKVIFENPATAFPFGLQIVFRGPVLFRYEIDRKDRKERYYSRNDPPLFIQAQNGIKIWVSNAANVELSAQAGGKKVDFSIGALGEVAVKHLKWIKTDSGVWQLALFDVD